MPAKASLIAGFHAPTSVTNQTLQRRHNAIMAQAKNTMRRIGLDLINERRRAFTTEKEKSDPSTFDGAETSHDRDLLSLLSKLIVPLRKTLPHPVLLYSPVQHEQYTLPTHVY